jgi:DNA-binding response OmpR family regulator
MLSVDVLPRRVAWSSRTKQRMNPHRMSPARTQRPRRILVVEDHEDTLQTTVELLSQHGYQLRVARDGWAAVTAAYEFVPDVVLLDIGLPVMSGYDAAKAMRADFRTAHALIIAISGWPRAREQGQSVDAPIDLYMAKPVPFADLLAAFREHGQAPVQSGQPASVTTNPHCGAPPTGSSRPFSGPSG